MINEFIRIVYANPFLYLSLSIFILFVYLFIIRKHIYFIFDPIMYNILGAAMGSTAVIYMFFNNMINNYYFFNYLLTQTFFLIGFLSNKPIDFKYLRNKKKSHFKNIVNIEKIIYLLLSLIFIISQTYSFMKIGIPLLSSTSRLEIYQNFGYIKRFIDGSLPLVIFLLSFRFFEKNYKKNFLVKFYDFIVLFFIIIALISTGSKGGLLTIIFSVSYYVIYIRKNKNSSINMVKVKFFLFSMFILAVFAALFVIFIGHEDFNIVFDKLLLRIILYGDIYIYSYTTNVLENINGGFIKAIHLFCSPIIGISENLFQLFSSRISFNTPKGLGLEIWQTLHNTEEIRGPNPRHNVFGLVYFGYLGSFIFSYFVGYIISYTRNKLYIYLPKDTVGGLIYLIFASSFIIANTDLLLVVDKFINFSLVFIPVFLLAYIIGNYKK